MKVLKNSLHLLLIVCLLVPMLLVPAGAVEAPIYLALGDSISTGYGLPEGTSSFVEQLADCYPDFTLVNEAVNGNKLSDVYNQIKGGALDEKIANAKLITLTCGGNDLIGTLYQNIADAYNAKNPTKPITGDDVLEIMAGIQTDTSYYPTKMNLYMLAVSTIQGFAGTLDDPDSGTEAFKNSLKDYKESLSLVMKYIRKRNSDVEIVVTTQYNPYISFQNNNFYKKIYNEVEIGVQKLNAVIKDQAATLDYTVSDVYEAFNNSEENLSNAEIIPNDFPNIDFHPNTAGHTVIKDTILAMDLISSFGYHKDTVSLSEGTIDVSVTALEGCANLVAAFYDAKGRMMGCDMEPVTDSNLQVTLSAKFSGTADHVRIFLLDSVTLAPIYDALTYPAK